MANWNIRCPRCNESKPGGFACDNSECIFPEFKNSTSSASVDNSISIEDAPDAMKKIIEAITSSQGSDPIIIEEEK